MIILTEKTEEWVFNKYDCYFSKVIFNGQRNFITRVKKRDLFKVFFNGTIYLCDYIKEVYPLTNTALIYDNRQQVEERAFVTNKQNLKIRHYEIIDDDVNQVLADGWEVL